MQIEIKLDESCKEPKIIIHTVLPLTGSCRLLSLHIPCHFLHRSVLFPSVLTK